MPADHSSPTNAAAARAGLAGDCVSGLRIVAQGFAMLLREPALWALSLVPVAFGALALAAAVALLFRFSGELDTAVSGLWPVLEATAWYAWLWVGPVRALFALLGLLACALIAGVSAWLAVLLASVAAAPFLDALARRVELLRTGVVWESGEASAAAAARATIRSMLGELRRLGFLTAVFALLFALGLIVPGAHVLTGPAAFAFTVLFLPLEFAGFALDRRGVAFAARRRWVRRRVARMAAFGTAAFVACFVPGLNLLMIPGLVVAGTLLVLDDPPPEIGPGVVARPAPRD